MQTVVDAFGNILQEGDKIAWIGNPSGWDKEIRKGTLYHINPKAGWYGMPTLTVRADKNDYSRYNKEACKDSVLVTCRDISGPSFTQRGTHFTFPRVMKL